MDKFSSFVSSIFLHIAIVLISVLLIHISKDKEVKLDIINIDVSQIANQDSHTHFAKDNHAHAKDTHTKAIPSKAIPSKAIPNKIKPIQDTSTKDIPIKDDSPKNDSPKNQKPDPIQDPNTDKKPTDTKSTEESEPLKDESTQDPNTDKKPTDTKSTEESEPLKNESAKDPNTEKENQAESKKKATLSKIQELNEDLEEVDKETENMAGSTKVADKINATVQSQIINFIKNNWNQPTGLKDIQKMSVDVTIYVDQKTGKIIKFIVDPSEDFEEQENYQILKTSVIQALKKSQSKPIPIPQKYYKIINTMNVQFSPKMFGSAR